MIDVLKRYSSLSNEICESTRGCDQDIDTLAKRSTLRLVTDAAVDRRDPPL
jgi:hypothetical protein